VNIRICGIIQDIHATHKRTAALLVFWIALFAFLLLSFRSNFLPGVYLALATFLLYHVIVLIIDARKQSREKQIALEFTREVISLTDDILLPDECAVPDLAKMLDSSQRERLLDVLRAHPTGHASLRQAVDSLFAPKGFF
jgi:hypothetical protein